MTVFGPAIPLVPKGKLSDLSVPESSVALCHTTPIPYSRLLSGLEPESLYWAKFGL
jgi:hypothetical protein